MRILARRQGWILGALLLSILAALAWSFLKEPIYESSVKLLIGQAGGQGSFELPEVVAARLVAEHGEITASGIRRPGAFVRRAAPLRGVPNVIDVVAVAEQPDEVASLLQRLTGDVLARHGEIHSRIVRSLEERRQRLLEERTVLQRQHAETTELLHRVREGSPVQASLLAVERSRLAQTLIETEAQLPELTQKLSPPQTRSSALLGGIEVPTKPTGLATVMLVVLFGFLGLVLGVLLAFVVEFLDGVRVADRGA